MGSLSARQFIEILVEQCPSYDHPLPLCPLGRLRAEPNVQKRRELVAAMGDAEIEELYRGHLSCVRKTCTGN